MNAMKRFADEELGLANKDDKEKDLNSAKKDVDSDNKKEILSRNTKLIFCFFGLQVSYVLWGVAQEQIMTQVYKPGKFTSSAVC